jgi:uncharacterized membrane protein
MVQWAGCFWLFMQYLGPSHRLWHPRYLADHTLTSLGNTVALILAWTLFALGFGHIAYGFVKFRAPLKAFFAAGYVGQFSTPEVRRSAFWFVIFGPLLMLAGHVAVHAVEMHDMSLLRLVGTYMLIMSTIGVFAYPRSPFLAGMMVSPLLLAASCGMF